VSLEEILHDYEAWKKANFHALRFPPHLHALGARKVQEKVGDLMEEAKRGDLISTQIKDLEAARQMHKDVLPWDIL